MTDPAGRPQYADNQFTTFAGLAARVSALERVVNSGGLTGSGAFHAHLGSDRPSSPTLFSSLPTDTVDNDPSGSYDPKTGQYSPNVAGRYFIYAGMYVDDMTALTKLVLLIAKNNLMKVPDSPIQVQTTEYGTSDISVPVFGVFDLDGIEDFIALGYASSGDINIVSGFQNTFFGGFLVAQSQGAQGG